MSQFIGEETEIPGGCFADVTRSTTQARAFPLLQETPTISAMLALRKCEYLRLLRLSQTEEDSTSLFIRGFLLPVKL